MQKIKYRISLDMLEVASQTTIKAKKGDTACSIVMTLTENGKIYHIADGCRAILSGKKADGNYLFNGETCRIEDNAIIYDFTKQTVSMEGVVQCEVVLYKGDEQLTTPRFNLLVDETVYNPDAIVSTPEADALKDLTNKAEYIVNQFDDGLIVGKGYVDNNFANAIKGTASGTEVCIKDISPIPHNIGVKLSNADAKLYRSGKNLFDQSLIPNYTLSGVDVQYLPEEDCFLIHGTATASNQKMCKLAIEIEPNNQYAISTEHISGSVTVPSGGNAVAYFGFNDDPNAGVSEKNNTNLTQTKSSKVFTVTKKYCNYFWIYYTNGVKFDNYKVRIQLEKNSVATDFEPYIEPTECVVNTDGTANVPSRYPSTRLFTDTESVTIEAEYNRDINKVFAELQAAIIYLGGILYV